MAHKIDTSGFSLFANVKRLLFGEVPLAAGCSYYLPDDQRCRLISIAFDSKTYEITHVSYQIDGDKDTRVLTYWYAIRALRLVTADERTVTSDWGLIPVNDTRRGR